MIYTSQKGQFSFFFLSLKIRVTPSKEDGYIYFLLNKKKNINFQTSFHSVRLNRIKKKIDEIKLNI